MLMSTEQNLSLVKYLAAAGGTTGLHEQKNKDCTMRSTTSTGAIAYRQLDCSLNWHPVTVGMLGQIQRHAGPVRGAALPERCLERQFNLTISQVTFGQIRSLVYSRGDKGGAGVRVVSSRESKS